MIHCDRCGNALTAKDSSKNKLLMISEPSSFHSDKVYESLTFHACKTCIEDIGKECVATTKSRTVLPPVKKDRTPVVCTILMILTALAHALLVFYDRGLFR